MPNGGAVGCAAALVLLGLAIWIFLRKLTDSSPIAYDGAAYPLRVFRAARAAVWLALLGVLILLNAFSILTFHHSWPFFIILAGVMAILERTLYQSAAAAYIPPAAPIPPAPDSTQGDN